LRLFRNVPVLIGMLKDVAIGGYRGLTKKSAAILLFAAAYLVIPFDLVSDLIPVLGQLDDAAVLMACLYAVEDDLERYKHWKKGHGEPH
jgi:uncharacterized membrane protein YkvA (DUF1232 family)